MTAPRLVDALLGTPTGRCLCQTNPPYPSFWISFSGTNHRAIRGAWLGDPSFELIILIYTHCEL